MSFIEAFFGSTQSQFTAYAIFGAVISICISIILTGTDMTIGNRFLLIFFVILSILPSILLMLLQITCMVTGGNKDDHWWCWLYSWIIAIFVIIYCIFVIIISLTSLFTYNNAISKVDMSEQNNKMSPESSNNYAKLMLQSNSKQEIEKFMNSMDEDEEQEDYSNMNKMIDDKDELKQNFVDGGMPKNMEDTIQKFTNDKDKKPLPPMSSMPSTPPTPPIPTPQNVQTFENKTPQVQPQQSTDFDNSKIDNFTSSEVLDDEEPEPFTNRNYASFR